MAWWAALWEYKSVILFYLVIAILIYLNRRKIEFQGKIVALYRTKLGLSLMDRLGQPTRWAPLGGRLVWAGLAVMGIATLGVLARMGARLLQVAEPGWIGGLGPVFAVGFLVFFLGLLCRPVKLLGRIAVVVGYAGMAIVTIFLLVEFNKLFTQPSAPAGVVPAIPGVRIPGSPIFIPFWYGMLSLFLVVVVHEFSHGIVARAHTIKVKNSGLVMFGPIPGAFVEPEEEELKRRPASVQNAIFAAGPFSNVILAALAMLLIVYAVDPLLVAGGEFAGVSFAGVQPNCPADHAQVHNYTVYTHLNGAPIANVSDFTARLSAVRPGENLTLSNENLTHVLTTRPHPDDPEKPFIGVVGVSAVQNPRLPWPLWQLLLIVGEFLFWVFLLSQGIGLINLLPVGPIDGGRMFHQAALKAFGERKGVRVWTAVSLVLLLVLGALILAGLFKGVFVPPAAAAPVCP